MLMRFSSCSPLPICGRRLKASLANLCGFPWIAEQVETGRLQLHGWYFDLDNGELLRLEERRFEPV